ncbi:hypothetical protein [Nocardioides sp.]|uniref:hypothetical protein n=1 Tax=Nocardioides sp. TaxID=35761 RepID=UPI002717A624|nr:hypothetical protein [Nocardioides sp.]MDO9458228.1 hypothetical protein [Nocardioides sp.]
MRFRSLLVLAAVAAVAAGCSEPADPVVVEPTTEAAMDAPAYDPALEPAAAVLAVVPGEATVLEVTDFDQVRLALGYGDLSSASEPAVLRRFWRQAEAEAPLLSPGMLRDQGTERYGFTQDDVSWEAHFTGPAGEGFVVKFRDDLDMAGVQRAAAATGGPLAGAVVVPAVQIAAVGATREPTESWAADPALVTLVGPKAGATYVSSDCLAVDEAFGGDVGGDLADDLAPTPAADLGALDALGPFSLGFGGRLVTARLGGTRTDVFERARLAETMPATDPEFGLGYVDPVADPRDGRIGFTLGDGPVAARLARERQLPFAVCGG